MGVLVFAFAIFSQSSVNSMYIMKAEVPGHKVGKLVSKISLTARILYGIYILLTVIEVGFLYAGGMSFFDCWIHAFSTAGTGGFSSHNASIAYFDSVYIETVITVFMILFGINFQLYYFLLLKKFKECYHFTLNCLGLPTLIAVFFGILGQPLTTMIMIQNILFVLFLVITFYRTHFRDEN